MMERNGKVRSLQGLRGIAILLIFISHYPFLRNAAGGNALGWAGALGVELFIMLSGYLSARQNDASVLVRGAGYFKQKIAKFYPLHIFTLACALPFSLGLLFLDRHFNTWIKLGLNALLLQSWVPIENVYFSFNLVSWYLSTNAFFILVGPVVLKHISDISLKKLVVVFSVTLVFQVVWCELVSATSIAHWAVYIFPVVRFLDFILGSCVYYVSRELRKISIQHKLTMVVCLLFTAVASSVVLLSLSLNSQSEFYSVCAWTLPCTMLLLSVALAEEWLLTVFRCVFENFFIVFVGNISFEFFLLHQLIIRYGSVLANKIGFESDILFGCVLLLTSIFVSCVVRYVLRKVKLIKRNMKGNY